MAIAETSVFVKGEPVTETGLKAIIQMEMENALGVDGGKLSTERRDALKHYMGEKYGNEVDGRSQVVDRTIMETVEWIMPALMRIFASADKIVEVEPQLPNDEEAAKERTEYLNYAFMRDNPGVMILYTWFKDALLQKVGWVKAYWDTERRTENEKYTGLTEEEYQALKADPDMEEVECVAYPAFGPIMGFVNQEQMRQGAEPPYPGEPLSALSPKPANDLAGASMAPTIYNCTFRRTYNEGRLKNVNVAPEEVLISRRATSRNVPFMAQRRKETRSELIQMGFDYDTVMMLSPFDEMEYNTERIERFVKNDEWPYRSNRTDPAMVEVWISECYLYVDMEGDGIAKLRKVTVAGDKAYTILGNELCDEVALHSITPIPMPHTLVGLSLCDLVDDLQLIKTVLWRQTLDNLYLTNNPRVYVNEDATTENTYDDLLTSRPGSLIRGRGPKANAVEDMVTPFVAGQSFQMLSYLDEQAEKRSGISKGNQGIAPDDLNNNAAIGSMGVGMLQEAAAQRVELIARIFAEGARDLFKANLGLIIRNQVGPRALKVAGEWKQMDPSSWKHQAELSVAVGLGTGNRDKMVQQAQQIMNYQSQAIAVQKGINGPFVTGDNLWNGAALMCTSMGYKNPEKFFTNPATQPPPPPPPTDPLVLAAQVKAQGDSQMAQMKAQSDGQTAQMKTQADAQLRMADIAMRERLGAAELQMKDRLEWAKLGLNWEQLQLDTEKAAHDIAVKHVDLGIKKQQADAAKVTTPGSPGELPASA